MSIDNTCERLSCRLTSSNFDQEIDILRKNHLPQGHRPIKQIGIVHCIRAVLLGGQDVDATEAQSPRHRAAYVHVRVQR